jgi:hypothetical protein
MKKIEHYGNVNRSRSRSWLVGSAVLSLLMLFAACPGPDSESPGGETGLPPPSLPPSGKYRANTLIEMSYEDEDPDASIYYTLDGTTPTEDSTRFSRGAIPRMTFDNGQTMVVKAIAVTEKGEHSRVANAAYEEWVPSYSSKMDTIRTQVAASPNGNDKEHPVVIVIPADFTLADVTASFPNPANPSQMITDGLGQIYEASGGKYFTLDLSQTNWRVPDDDGIDVPGIPGISSADGVSFRANKDKLVSFKLPAATEYIGNRAFSTSTGLQTIDLNGLSHLKAIGISAFYQASEAEILDLTGCTSLVSIGDNAFTYPRKLKYLDFSPATSLKSIGKYAFSEPRSAKYIEFPASLEMLHDYQFRDCYSLEYVRFHGPVSPNWGWCQFNYHDWEHTWEGSGKVSFPYNGLDSIHLAEGVDGAWSYRTDHMVAVYHPLNLTYTRSRGGYYDADDDGYYFMGHNIPESTPGPKGVWNPNPQQAVSNSAQLGADSTGFQEEFRGLASIILSATGLTAAEGKPVAVRTVQPFAPASQLADPVIATGTISGGEVSFTINTPPADKLLPLNQETGQLLTGKYGTPRNVEKAADPWGAGTSNAQPAVFGNNAGVLGKPWISASDVKFALLELVVDGSKKLERSAIGGSQGPWGGFDVRHRTVLYVYVDKPVLITRVMREKLHTVTLSLLPGWNMVERVYFGAAPEFDYDNDDIPVGTGIPWMSLWISAGIIEETSSTEATPVMWNNTTAHRQIPWVIKE